MQRDQLKREIEAEIGYYEQRLADDFNSLRYRTKEPVTDLDGFNQQVQSWLQTELDLLARGLDGLTERTSRDLRQIDPAAPPIRPIPVPRLSAPELAARSPSKDDTLRKVISLGGGGLVAVMAEALFSQGPAAAVATGAAAGLAAYVTLGQNAAKATFDPVQAYFELMEKTTVAALRTYIDAVSAALHERL